MGTRYVVTVTRVEDVDGSENRYATRDTTLFEATHHDPARLARFAPEELLAVLAEAAGVEVTVPAVGLLPLVPAVPRPADEDGKDPAPADPPRRKRRTKAEIEADKAAQAAPAPEPAGHETTSVVEGPWPTGAPAMTVPPQVAASIEQHAELAAAVVPAEPVFNPFK